MDIKEVEICEALYHKGFSDREIASALNLNRNTIACWRDRTGLTCNKKRYQPTARQRQLVIGMIADLVYLTDKVKQIPDQDGITRFIREWRKGRVNDGLLHTTQTC